MFHDVLDKKETILEQKNNNFSEGQNWQFCKGVSPWFFSKNAKFSFTFFKGKVSLEITFHDVLDKKETVLDYKNNNFSEGLKSQFSWRG